ncbi:MAG: hypothetical protein L0211_20000 [Planctomycetaceae bacterium]|nr:hypothetical protein [Planctomycetaceae bacterium]
MDKVKAQLALVKQHSFWLMCIGILIVCLVSWYMSTKAIYQEQQAQFSAIMENFKGLDAIPQTNPKHPNAKTEEGMDALLKAYTQQVVDSWQSQYDRQADVLVWPASFREDALFIEQVDKLRPIEIVPFPTPITSDLPDAARRIYRDYILTEIPILARTCGAEWYITSVSAAGGGTEGYGGYGASGSGSGLGGLGGGAIGSAGGYGAPGAATGGYPGSYSGAPGSDGTGQLLVEDKSVVRWAPENQQQLLTTHFGFVSREIAPTTLEVLYAQEDLWVLQNIMDIIRAANDQAVARHEAAIKEIDFIRIGRSAIGMAGTISSVGASAAGMDGGMMSGGMAAGGSPGGMTPGGMTPGGMTSGSPGSTASADGGTATAGYGASSGYETMSGGTAATSVDPAYGRYVDANYAVLDPAKLRSALNSQTKDDVLLAVAKRMPVRMRFRIDQRKMNKVLAECGNSKLPVEVRQVRLNRPAAPVGGEGGGYGGYGGYGGDTASSIPGASGGLGGYGSDSSSDGGYGSGGYGSGGYGSGGYGSGSSGAVGGYGSGGYGSGGYGSGGYGGMGGIPGAAATKARPVGGASSTAAADYNLVDVELWGIVYIYNPVNKTQLGVTPPATAAAPATTPTTPASSPAPPATGPATSTPPAAIVPGVGAE